MKGDVLRDVDAVKMGQIPAAMPPGSANLPIGGFKVPTYAPAFRRRPRASHSAIQENGVPGLIVLVFIVGHGTPRAATIFSGPPARPVFAGRWIRGAGYFREGRRAS